MWPQAAEPGAGETHGLPQVVFGIQVVKVFGFVAARTSLREHDRGRSHRAGPLLHPTARLTLERRPNGHTGWP